MFTKKSVYRYVGNYFWTISPALYFIHSVVKVKRDSNELADLGMGKKKDFTIEGYFWPI